MIYALIYRVIRQTGAHKFQFIISKPWNFLQQYGILFVKFTRKDCTIMKVYIIASPNNVPIAKEFLASTKGVKIIQGPSANSTEVTASICKEKLKNVDYILTIIDNSFADDVSLNTELSTVLNLSKENNLRFLVVSFEDATVPVEIKDYIHISCHAKKVSDSWLHILFANILSLLNSVRKKEKKPRNPPDMEFTGLLISLFAIVISITLQFSIYMSSPIVKLSLFLFILITIILLILNFIGLIPKHEDTYEIKTETYSKKLEQTLSQFDSRSLDCCELHSENAKTKVDALGLMQINLENINEYYTWSQEQAKSSFKLAERMCIAGFTLITLAALFSTIYRQNADVSLVPAIGGVVTELIAGTALLVYKSSLTQLNHYHRALHEDERFLSSVNLLKEFDAVETHDAMLQEIIQSEIQMNLIESASRKDDNSYKRKKET